MPDALPGVLLEAFGPWGIGLIVLALFLVAFRSEVRAIIGTGKVKPEQPTELQVLRLAVKQQASRGRRKKAINCRQQMLADLTRIRYEAFDRHITKVSRWDIGKLSSADLYRALYSLIEDAVAEAEALCRREKIHPSVIGAFRVAAQDQTDVVMNSLRAICESSALKGNVERLDLIFQVLAEVIKNSRNVADELVAEFEGELHGYEYKGFTCGDVPADSNVRPIHGEKSRANNSLAG